MHPAVKTMYSGGGASSPRAQWHLEALSCCNDKLYHSSRSAKGCSGLEYYWQITALSLVGLLLVVRCASGTSCRLDNRLDCAPARSDGLS